MEKIIKSSPYTNFDIQRSITNRLMLLSKGTKTNYGNFIEPSKWASDDDLKMKKPSTIIDPKTNYMEKHAYFHSDTKPVFMEKELSKITSYKYNSKELNKENNMYAFNVHQKPPTSGKLYGDYKDFTQKFYGIPDIKFKFNTYGPDKVAGVVGLSYDERVVKAWQNNTAAAAGTSTPPGTPPGTPRAVASPVSTPSSPAAPAPVSPDASAAGGGPAPNEGRQRSQSATPNEGRQRSQSLDRTSQKKGGSVVQKVSSLLNRAVGFGSSSTTDRSEQKSDSKSSHSEQNQQKPVSRQGSRENINDDNNSSVRSTTSNRSTSSNSSTTSNRSTTSNISHKSINEETVRNIAKSVLKEGGASVVEDEKDDVNETEVLSKNNDNAKEMASKLDKKYTASDEDIQYILTHKKSIEFTDGLKIINFLRKSEAKITSHQRKVMYDLVTDNINSQGQLPDNVVEEIKNVFPDMKIPKETAKGKRSYIYHLVKHLTPKAVSLMTAFEESSLLESYSPKPDELHPLGPVGNRALGEGTGIKPKTKAAIDPDEIEEDLIKKGDGKTPPRNYRDFTNINSGGRK